MRQNISRPPNVCPVSRNKSPKSVKEYTDPVTRKVDPLTVNSRFVEYPNGSLSLYLNVNPFYLDIRKCSPVSV
jgi:hypothetical protein